MISSHFFKSLERQKKKRGGLFVVLLGSLPWAWLSSARTIPRENTSELVVWPVCQALFGRHVLELAFELPCAEVLPLGSAALAIPKSITRTLPSGFVETFWGERSQGI